MRIWNQFLFAAVIISQIVVLFAYVGWFLNCLFCLPTPLLLGWFHKILNKCFVYTIWHTQITLCVWIRAKKESHITQLRLTSFLPQNWFGGFLFRSEEWDCCKEDISEDMFSLVAVSLTHSLTYQRRWLRLRRVSTKVNQPKPIQSNLIRTNPSKSQNQVPHRWHFCVCLPEIQTRSVNRASSSSSVFMSVT